jgi:hypothetical protein
MARGAPGEEGYTPQVSAEDLPRKVVPRMEPVPVGQAFEQAADASNRKYNADSATYAGDELTKAHLQAVQDFETAQRNAPEGDQTGFTQKYLANFDKKYQPLIDTVGGNPLAKQMVQNGLGNLRATLQNESMRWEAKQNVDYDKTSIFNNVKASLAMVEAHPGLGVQIGQQTDDQITHMRVDQPSDRDAMRKAVFPQIALAEANGLTRQDPRGALQALNDPEHAPAGFKPVVTGLTDAQRETVRAKANDELTKPIYTQLEDNDFAGAQKNLYAQRDLMDPKTVYQMQNIIDAKSKEKANENKQDIADRYQDSLVAGQYGLPHAAAVTRAEMDVLAPHDAQRKWDALQGIIAAGSKAQEYDRMTPEQINADVNSAKPTEGGTEAALKIKAYEIRANAADQSLKARNQDPAQFAIDSGAGWKPLDLSKPEDALAQLKSRANSQGQVSEQTGVNTPLLSKQETKQFTAWLDNQKSSDRLQTLTSLRTNLPNDQAYGALMKQIAPGSPITAVAGAMLDKPPAGQAPWFDSKFATNPIVPQRMLEGEQILRGKDEKGITSKFPMPPDKDLQAQFQSAVGGANSDLFRGRPETLETAFAAYKAYYAAESSHRGITNGVINTDIARTAAENVVGHTTNYGSTNLVVPSGMDPSRFEGAVNAASQSALKAGGYGDKDIEALRGYGLRELGETLGTGRYVIIDGNGDPLKSKSGRNSVIIDLNKARSQHASVFEPDAVHAPAGVGTVVPATEPEGS